jgi:uncharacterized damage-inducible protein DinB
VTATVPTTAADELRFPTGKFHRPKGALETTERKRVIDVITATPKNLSDAVRGLSERQLDTPYREGGWTVRQVVHHVADSHMNAFIRIKLAMTEDSPTIKTYDEAAWANLIDGREGPVDASLTLLASLHERWVRLLRSLAPADFSRTMTHPEHGPVSIDFMLALYGWHGPHHTAHITGLRKREGWSLPS